MMGAQMLNNIKDVLPKLAEELKKNPPKEHSDASIVTKYNLPDLTMTSREDMLDSLPVLMEAIATSILPVYSAKVNYNAFTQDSNALIVKENLVNLAKVHSKYKSLNETFDKLIDFDGYLAQLYHFGILKSFIIFNKPSGQFMVVFYLHPGELLSKNEIQLLATWVTGGELTKEDKEYISSEGLIYKVRHDSEFYLKHKLSEVVPMLLSRAYSSDLNDLNYRISLVNTANSLYFNTGHTSNIL